MITVNQLLRSHSGDLSIEVQVNGILTVNYKRANDVSKDHKYRVIREWSLSDRLVAVCGVVCNPPREALTVTRLCGLCSDKSLMVSVNGGAPRHVYSMHPEKDNQVVRKWSVTDGVLHLHTWPWRAQVRG